MNINIPNKNTGDSHFATEFNLFKEAINSKADSESLQQEINDRIANELIFEAGFQSKVNKTDYQNDNDALDLELQAKLEAGDLKTINGFSIVGEGDITIAGGEDVNLDNYYTIPQSNNRFQLIGDYLTSVDYSIITGKPSIPTKTSDILNDNLFVTASIINGLATQTYVNGQGFIDATYLNNFYNIAQSDARYSLTGHTHAYSSLSGLPSLFSGSYLDLTNKPSIPSIAGLATEAYADNAVSGKTNIGTAYTKSESDSKYSVTGHTHSYSSLSGLPTLFDSNYNSLTNKPTLQNISLTTIGSNGAATLVGNVLNIPNYAVSGSTGGTVINGTGFVVANGSTVTYDNSLYLTTSGATNTYQTIANTTTALALKAPLASPTFTGTVVLPATTSIGSVTNTQLGYVAGVTSAIQTQFNAKAPLASPTFTGTVTLPTGTVGVTQTAGNNTTALATTAFVASANSSFISNSSDTYSAKVTQIVTLSSAEYSAITTPVSTTLYIII